MRATFLALTGLLFGMTIPTADAGKSRPGPSVGNGKQSAALLSDSQLAGVFVSQAGQQSASFYAHKDQGVAACFYGKMGHAENGEARLPDLAIYANEREAGFQILDKDGRVHFVPATALLKLEKK